MSEAPPRWRLFWPRSLAGKALVVAAALAVVLGVAYAAATRAMSRRLEEAWALSAAFGLPNDLRGLLGERVPEKDDSATPIDEAEKVAGQFLNAERARLKNADDIDLLRDASYLAAMDRLLAETNYEALVAEADRRPGYYSPIVPADLLVNTVLTYLQSRRELVRAEQAIARRLTGQGKRGAAVERLVRMHRLMRRWEDREPFLVGILVNIAVRAALIVEINVHLRQGGPLSPAVHDAVERELAETEHFLQVWPRVLQSEKLWIAELYGKYTFFYGGALAGPLKDNDLAHLLRHIHGWMKLNDRPFYQVKGDIDALEAELAKTLKDPLGRRLHEGTRTLLPALIMGRKAFDRLIAFSRCGRIVNAMARRGDFGLELESLGLPAECLVDPFDGKPIRVKRTEKGPIVYSIGSDLSDDGGNLLNGKDAGLGPVEHVVGKR